MDTLSFHPIISAARTRHSSRRQACRSLINISRHAHALTYHILHTQSLPDHVPDLTCQFIDHGFQGKNSLCGSVSAVCTRGTADSYKPHQTYDGNASRLAGIQWNRTYVRSAPPSSARGHRKHLYSTGYKLSIARIVPVIGCSKPSQSHPSHAAASRRSGFPLLCKAAWMVSLSSKSQMPDRLSDTNGLFRSESAANTWFHGHVPWTFGMPRARRDEYDAHGKRSGWSLKQPVCHMCPDSKQVRNVSIIAWFTAGT